MPYWLTKGFSQKKNCSHFALPPQAGVPSSWARMASMQYLVSMQLSLAGVGGLTPAVRTAVVTKVAAAANTTADAVTLGLATATAPVGRRLLQVPTTLELLASLTSDSKVTSAATLAGLTTNSATLAAGVSTATGRTTSVPRAARRDLTFGIVFTLPATASASAASASAAVVSAKLSSAAAAGTLLASDAALRSSATASLSSPPSVALTYGMLGPPSPPPPSPPPSPPPPPLPEVKRPLLRDNELAAVLICSVIGLVIVLGLAAKLLSSLPRPGAKVFRQSLSRKTLPATNVSYKDEDYDEHDQAPAGEEGDAIPPLPSREPWERTPVPTRPVPRAEALLAEHAGGAISAGGPGGRRAELLSKMADDHATPRAAAAPPADFGGGGTPVPEISWIANPLSLAERADVASGSGSDDDSPLPQQLHASEWARLSRGSPPETQPERFSTPQAETPRGAGGAATPASGPRTSASAASSQYDTPTRQDDN